MYPSFSFLNFCFPDCGLCDTLGCMCSEELSVDKIYSSLKELKNSGSEGVTLPPNFLLSPLAPKVLSLSYEIGLEPLLQIHGRNLNHGIISRFADLDCKELRIEVIIDAVLPGLNWNLIQSLLKRTKNFNLVLIPRRTTSFFELFDSIPAEFSSSVLLFSPMATSSDGNFLTCDELFRRLEDLRRFRPSLQIRAYPGLLYQIASPENSYRATLCADEYFRSFSLMGPYPNLRRAVDRLANYRFGRLVLILYLYFLQILFEPRRLVLQANRSIQSTLSRRVKSNFWRLKLPFFWLRANVWRLKLPFFWLRANVWRLKLPYYWWRGNAWKLRVRLFSSSLFWLVRKVYYFTQYQWHKSHLILHWFCHRGKLNFWKLKLPFFWLSANFWKLKLPFFWLSANFWKLKLPYYWWRGNAWKLRVRLFSSGLFWPVRKVYYFTQYQCQTRLNLFSPKREQLIADNTSDISP